MLNNYYMKNIEIKTGQISGTSIGGVDYIAPKFENGDFFVPDPRTWLKDDERITNPTAGTASRCDVAVRVENGGLLFLVWYRGGLIGSREGDGRFVYIFVPFEKKWPGSLSEFLNWVTGILREQGKLPDGTIEKWTSANGGSMENVPQIGPSPRKGKYAYINCSRPQGPSLESVINMRFQKVFSEYCWVLLSGQDARTAFKTADVVDITDKLEPYCSWNPQDSKVGEWCPTLWFNGKEVAPNAIIFDDKTYRFEIEWKNPEPTIRYSKKEIVTYRDLSSGKLEGFFHNSEIFESHTLSLKGSSSNDVVEVLEYKSNNKSYAIEYQKKDNRYVVFLPSGFPEVSQENIVIKRGQEAFFELIKGPVMSLQRKPQTIITKIVDGDITICKFEDGEILSNQHFILENQSGNEKKKVSLSNTRTVVYRLKTKVSIPIFVACVIAALLLGVAAGFFAGKYYEKNFNTQPTQGVAAQKDEEDKLSEPPTNSSLDETDPAELEQKNTINSDETKVEDLVDNKRNNNVSSGNSKGSTPAKGKEEKEYSIEALVDDSQKGLVRVIGDKKTGKNGEVITVKAKPRSTDFVFDHWDDGTKDNPKKITIIDKDIRIVAIFKEAN